MMICAVGITLIVSLVVLRQSNSFLAPPPICTIRKNYAARYSQISQLRDGEEDRIKKVGGGTNASYPEGDLSLFNPEEAGKLQGTGSLSDRLGAGADYVPTPPPLPSRSEYDDIVAGSAYTSSDAAASDVMSSPREVISRPSNELVAADIISPTDISQQQQTDERDDVYAERLLAEEWAAAVEKAAEQSRLEREQRSSEAWGRQEIDMNVQTRIGQEEQLVAEEQARRLAEELARIEEEERMAIEEQTRIEEEQLAVAEQARIEAEERMAAEARIEEEKRLAAEEAAEAARPEPETEVRRFRTLREQFEFEQAEQQRLMRIEAEKDRGIRRDIERN